MAGGPNYNEQTAAGEKTRKVPESSAERRQSETVEACEEFVYHEVRTAIVNGVAVYYRASSRRRLSRSTNIL